MPETPLPFLAVPAKARANTFGFKRRPAVRLDTGNYQYAQLGDNQIRVLSISVDPTTGSLICTFRIRDLASSLGAYRAISYCWGDPTPTHRILCSNGQSLQVTNSAAETLMHLISQSPTEFFWIDQLCINQKESVEKAAQVLLMGQIYSSTKQVIAWLGRGDRGSKKAVAFVETLSKEIEDMMHRGLHPTLEPLMSLPAVRIRNLPTKIQEDRNWSALRDLLRNPWFERVWVMQEVIMACAETSTSSYKEHRVLLRFGKSVIAFDVLAEVLKILENDHLLPNLVYDRKNSDGTNEYGVEPPGVNAITLFSTLRDGRSRGTPIILSQALSRAWHFKATDDRDKLFAVLGFCDDEVADESLRPDYGSTVEDIYTAWTTALLESAVDYPMPLHMAGVGLPRSHASLPSWVPDFSSSSYEVGLRPKVTRYRASGDIKKPELVIDRLSLSMRIQATKIDTIEVIWTHPSSGKNDRWYRILKPLLLTPEKDFWKSLIQRLESIETFLRTPSPASENNTVQPREVLWQTLIGDYDIDDTAYKTDLSQAFESWYKAGRELAGIDKSKFLASQSRTADFYNQIQTFEDQQSLSSQDRPIFGTAQRRLLGHGPKKLLANDTLCIVNGAATPFLLREVTDDAEGRGYDNRRWRLVGSCFVHGLMYGEGLSMAEMEEFVVI